ncbi:MAG: ATP-binding protein, partial [Parvibaculales bacterium]
CAVSSSSLDPACFFGQTGDYFLWDYELPSFSRRAGENSGYYLLATPSESMRKAIKDGIEMLGSESVADELVDQLLREISSRGMPTLKRLAAGGTTAWGEIGTLVALRILQGDFTSGSETLSIAPVKDMASRTISLIVPVDPFTSQIDALRKSLGGHRGERPDLLVVKIRFNELNAPDTIRIMPLEIKTRSGIMAAGQRKEALQQAASFSEFLSGLSKESEVSGIWAIAQKHLYGAWIDYGFRIYGQLDKYRDDPGWIEYHQSTMAALLGGLLRIEIESQGRLVIIDGSSKSEVSKTGNVEFDNTLIVTHQDADKIIRAPEDSIIGRIVNALGDWSFWDAGEEQEPTKALKSPEIRDGVNPTESGPSQTLDYDQSGKQEGHEGDPNTIHRLFEVREESEGRENEDAPEGLEEKHDLNSGVLFEVGESIDGFTTEKFSYHPSNTALNHLNIGVIGDMGAGKTQLLQALIYNLSQCKSTNRGIEPNVLIFDYKKDYSSSLFVKQTGARIIEPYGIPLNLFDTTSCTNQLNPVIERSRFFCDVLSKIYTGIGHKQRQLLKEAVKSAYKSAGVNGEIAPTLKDVFENYRERGAIDSPYGIMSDLVDQGMFVESAKDAIPFKEFFKGVVVINLGSLGGDNKMKNMLVAIFLNLFYEHMLRIDKRDFIGADPQLRALDSFLLADEADNIMRYDFQVLQDILLQGREFGVGVILSSQYPSHFKTQNVNYAQNLRSWFIHQIPDISVKALQSMGFTHVDEQTVEKVKALKCHECLYRTFGIDQGEFMRGHPFYQLVQKP